MDFLSISIGGSDYDFTEYCEMTGVQPATLIEYCKYCSYAINEATDELFVFVTVESVKVNCEMIMNDAIKYGFVPNPSPIMPVEVIESDDLPF
jgi:hypothetical protein